MYIQNERNVNTRSMKRPPNAVRVARAQPERNTIRPKTPAAGVFTKLMECKYMLLEYTQ